MDQLTFNDYSAFASSLISRPPHVPDEDAGVFDIVHGGLGLASEVGEISDALKRQLAYGVEMDYPNLLEECGDILFYINMVVRGAGYTLSDAARSNEIKLRLRHGAKFNHKAAVDKEGRDLAAERAAMEGVERCPTHA